VISQIFIERPKLAFVISIVITLAGLITLITLPVNMYPQLAPPQVQVSASFPGASALVMEESVVRPIEQQLNGVEGMLYIESASANDGTATITVTFETGTDTDIAQVNVQNRVAIAEPVLPEDVKRQGLLVRKQSDSMLVGVNLYSERPELDGLFLSNYATNNLQESVARIPGVASAQVMGARNYSMRIWLDPDKMHSLGITLTDVSSALREQNQIVAAGKLGQEPSPAGQQFVYTVQAQGRLLDVEEFNEVIVRDSEDGNFVRLRDVARIELGSHSYDSTAKLNGKPTAFLVVYQLPDANALEVAEQVKAEMVRLSELFPDGLKYSILFDSTKFIERAIEEVQSTLYEAIALVILGGISVFTELAGYPDSQSCHTGIIDRYVCRHVGVGLFHQHDYPLWSGVGHWYSRRRCDHHHRKCGTHRQG
jgi:HAE1 family hydrophobic/amphiphilic exporter-1